MNKHLLVIWDADAAMDLPNGPGLYQDLSDDTIPYLLANSGDPRVQGGWTASQARVEARLAEFIDGFAAHLTTSTCPPNIRVIVCSAVEQMSILLYGKQALVYFPPEPMGIEEIENWVIRGYLINRHDRQQAALEETITLLHRNDGITCEADINRLRRAVGEHFDHTLVRWGHCPGHRLSPDANGKAVA